MLEKPNIEDSRIKDCLKREFNLDISNLIFLPIGNDVNTAVYRLDLKDESALFLKLRGGDFDDVGVVIPSILHGNGV